MAKRHSKIAALAAIGVISVSAISSFSDGFLKEAGKDAWKLVQGSVQSLKTGWYDVGRAAPGYWVTETYNPGYIEKDTYNPGKLAATNLPKGVNVTAPDGGYDVAAPDYGTSINPAKTYRNFSPNPTK